MKQCHPHPPRVEQPPSRHTLLPSSSSSCTVASQLSKELVIASRGSFHLFNKDDTCTIPIKYLELVSLGQNAREAK